MDQIQEIKQFLESCSSSDRQKLYAWLREKYYIHPIEKELGAPAQVILEAIARSSDLTKRGIRGIIAEATFKTKVVDCLSTWKDITPDGDHAYDFLLRSGQQEISIQVKMQRKKAQRPMLASEGYRSLSNKMFTVETQRTRGGKDPKTGEDTRPYRFGEFDILAVSMQASTGDWNQFRYTVANWLLPRPEDTRLILKFQPVSLEPNDDWTDDFETCIGWFMQNKNKVIQGKLTD